MGYWVYYLAWFAASYAARSPWLLAGVVLFFLLRRWLPDPAVYLATFGRIRGLESQRAANPANITARRDLARIYLSRKRPGKALTYLEEARVRAPEDAELLYLTGLCLHAKGRNEEALAPLVKAVEVDSRVAFGEPYRVAGAALLALGRLDEAEDALLRYLDMTSSSVEAHLLLARVARRAGRAADARRWVDEAIATHRGLPAFARRKQLGARLAAELARATVKRSPAAIVVLVLLVAMLGGAVLQVGRWAQARPRSAAKPAQSSPLARLPMLHDDEDDYDDASLEDVYARIVPKPDRFRRLKPTELATRRMEWPRAIAAGGGLDVDLALVHGLCGLVGIYGAPDGGDDPSFAFEDTETGLFVGARVLDGAISWGVQEGASLERRMTAMTGLQMVSMSAGPRWPGGRPVTECEIFVVRGGERRRMGLRGGESFSEPASAAPATSR